MKITSFFFPILVLLSALSISAVAAYYSIVGLTTIFSGAILAVAIMGSVLEIGKLVTAAWLKTHWKRAPTLLKLYLSTAVLILMFITSMGIFGYLSKAHLQQTASLGDNSLKIELLENKINREKKRILDAEIVIDQLDKAVNVLSEHDRISGPRGAIAVRESQQNERQRLNDIISESGDNISTFQEEKMSLETKQLSVEAEVGPIKYIAEFIYGEEQAADMLDKAVRAVIIVLIFVFDPLAVLMLLAAVLSFQYRKEDEDDQEKNINKDEGAAGAPKKLEGPEEYMEEEEKKHISHDPINDPEGPSLESLKEMPEIDFNNVKIIKRGNIKKPKKQKIVSRNVPYIMENVKDKKPDIQMSETPVNPGPVSEKPVDNKLPDVNLQKAINEAIEKVSENASLSFNFSNEAGNVLKKELNAAIHKQLQNNKK